MSDLEQRILDVIQDGFPVVERPYAAIADLLNRSAASLADGCRHLRCCSEQQVFDVVESLRSSGVIRRIGGVYDTKRLGLVSRLCAGKVPENRLDQFAATVMEISAITHNYIRSHEYNVWFTVIAENETALQTIIENLCGLTALHDVHSMPARKMFKINTVMTRQSCSQKSSGTNPMGHAGETQHQLLTHEDKIRIRLLSGDIPHTLTPFKDVFQNARLCESMCFVDFLDCARRDISEKRMRRFGAVLRHQQAGFPYNAMVCFDVGENASEAGAKLAANPHVSHCYERPPFEGFPYNVYGMFHAQSEDELSRFVQEAAETLGNPKYAVLHSLKELKKTSYKYFAE
ncbi:MULTISPECIES: Lrp/AsnC family transcriptional regulator [unclassified Fibrobacter]|uniref:Lrp/AsnC family transcriptional regulator n=1 Tax=unclassified Fibrobacter TaxID=2634177 RepID=UPI000D6AA0EA|nr:MULTISPECIES: Lrp/AsnC family transcriptional regulator [unclassified Fibrobacter]PWJ69963.1 AsnC family transcriptional regulator [Fibrobacter sp. UWR4]PZW73134.1 AsnC family transcriptional regulator [Fibrobacter sp. UWR1]